MKQRITYISLEHGGVDPSTLEITNDSLDLKDLKAAKEWRITLDPREVLLPEVVDALKKSHEIHIRWASELPNNAISPFASRLPSGLHVFYTPGKDDSGDDLCHALAFFFGKTCTSIESFSKQPILSERFAMSATYQLYKPLASLDQLIMYLSATICRTYDTECRAQLALLRTAGSLDVDYDAISNSLRIAAYWDWATWNATLRRKSTSDALEVGILNSEKADEPEEISLSGLLTVVGEDSKPKSTMFSFPSRHHATPGGSLTTNFRAAFRQPTGLHPTLEIGLSASTLEPPDESCALHAYFTLPSSVFIDRYQFSDPLFLASHNLVALRSLSGATDLEAPIWATSQWGSAALFELAHPEEPTSGQIKNNTWIASIPLHARYLPPSDNGIRTAKIPWPAVFWACRSDEGHLMSVNPFDRTNLGYDGLFSPKTLFRHIGSMPGPETLVETLELPVLNKAKTGLVSMGTTAVVLLGFLWVIWRLVSGSQRRVQKAKKVQ